MGATFGPVIVDVRHGAFLGAVAPTALVSEVTDVGLICCESPAEPTWRHLIVKMFSNWQCALNLVQCRHRAQGNEELVAT